MTPSNRTYSDFFSSGLRAMAGSSLTRRPRTASSPTPTMTLPENTRKQRRRSSIIDFPCRLLERIQSLSERRHYDVPISYEKHPILDPFDVSPNSTSLFVESIGAPSPNQRPQSFLLLGDSAESIFRLRFPIQRTRRRPTSVQSMPLPSASVQYNPRVTWDKYEHEHEWDWDRDRSWALHEEEEFEEEDTSIWIEEEDPAATIDWRQFHNDLLNED
ncbi:hypothetical protein FB45DRAFT_889796 [Roridomyces roridus]|uniref:Uncharacterized protein n=1 Tax=Roridomyces roridus TaxID=1738132 RepID=A0AAD7CL04_9AGAR|nr:hypothetical protein FB45DRAFT_889796 [Roridomyces roridus]